MHASAYQWLETIAGTVKANRVLEFGSRNVNGSCRPLFPGAEYVGIDIADGPGVDVVCPAESFTGDGRLFDCVVCTEVLEHTAAGREICANAFRLLNHGGAFIVTCATTGRAPHSAIDGNQVREGEYYLNVTKDAMAKWLAIFRKVSMVDSVPCDLYAIAIK
jgi:hypothetical protein